MVRELFIRRTSVDCSPFDLFRMNRDTLHIKLESYPSCDESMSPTQPRLRGKCSVFLIEIRDERRS